MPKFFLIASVIFMLGSGVLGWLNKTKLDEKTGEAEAAKNATTAAAVETTKAKAALKEANNKLTVDTTKVTELEQAIAAREGDLAKATSDVTNLTAQLTEKTAAVDAANAELEALKAGGITPPAGEVPVAGNDAQVAELTAQIEALKSEKQIIGDKLVAAESKSREMSDTIARAKNAVMAKGLEGQVTAVNQAWGFVVLNLGDRSGVVSNAEMIVMRDGDRIGKVKITSVEPSNSIADIVGSTVPEGQRVMPGDRVIYSGN